MAPDLLGGAFTLDPEAARRAIVTRVTAPMGLALDDATRVIRAIADNHMTGAIPIVSVERVLRDQTG